MNQKPGTLKAVISKKRPSSAVACYGGWTVTESAGCAVRINLEDAG